MRGTRTRFIATLGGALLAALMWVGPAEAGHRRVGVMLDAGVPDGANASLVLRPLARLRVHAGGSYNMVSKGVRAGVSFTPLPWWFAPSLSVEAGRYFSGDANGLARMLSGDPELHSAVLEDVSYDYANAHLGLELGYARFTFYVRGGASVINTRIRNLQAELDFGGDDGEMQPSVELRSDPTVRLITPSARVGVILYF